MLSKRILLVVLSLFCFHALADSTKVRVVTEVTVPLQYLEDGEVQGIATNIVRELFARTPLTPDIQLLPWARAYSEALAHPNLPIFSIAKTRLREPYFHWVGPIMPHTWAIFRQKSRADIHVNEFADLAKYSIGVVNGDVTHDYLSSKGLKNFPEGNLSTVASQPLNYRKLFAGRVDLIAMGSLSCVTDKIDCAQFERVWTLDELPSGLYLALRKDSDAELVKTLNSALDSMKKDGVLTKLQTPIFLLHKKNNPGSGGSADRGT